MADRDETRQPTARRAAVAVLGALVAPLLVLAVLRVRPTLDATRQNHPAHFWLSWRPRPSPWDWRPRF